MSIWVHPDAMMIVFGYKSIREGSFKYFSDVYGVFTPFIPFFMMFGLKGATVRFAQSLFLALGTLITYLFTEKLYDKYVATLTFFLLVMFPFYIFQANAEIPLLPFFTTLSFLFLIMYVKTQKKKYIYLSSLILGYGATVKLSLVYFAVSLVMSFFSLRYILKLSNEHIKKSLTKLNLKDYILILSFFLIGLSILIWVEILYNFALIKEIKTNFFRTEYGYKNTDVLNNIQTQLSHFKEIFSHINTYVYNPIGYKLVGSIRGYVWLILLILSMVILFKEKDYWSIHLMLTILFFSFLCTFTPSHSKANHLVPIIPFVALIIGRGLSYGIKLSVGVTYRKGEKGDANLWSFNLKIISIGFLILAVFTFLTIVELNYILSTERNLERYSDFARFHSRVPECVKDTKTIFTPFVWQVDYLRAYFLGIKNITTINDRMKYSDGKMVRVTNRQDLLVISQLLRDDDDIAYIFAPSPIIGWRYYFWSCMSPVSEEESICYLPFTVFKEEAEKLGKNIILDCVVKDSQGDPVFEIYKTN